MDMSQLQDGVRMLFGILFLGGLLDILTMNTRFTTRRYSNGVKIVKDNKTGDQYLVHKDASNMVKIEEGTKQQTDKKR